MPEETHITGIEKIGNGTHHAIYIKGVVDGQPVEGLVPMDAFQAEERKGEKALREYLKDGLGAMHEYFKDGLGAMHEEQQTRRR